MATGAWQELYASDLQSLWALVAVPALFLAWLAARGRARAARDADPQSRFVLAWAIAFSAETILDPIATGPFARGLDLSPGAAQDLGLLFVLLGDWRVWLLVGALAVGPARRAAVFAGSGLATLVVPLVAFGSDAALRQRWPGLPGQALWLVYELAFAALALGLRAHLLPRLAAGAGARCLGAARAVLAYAAAYYALWAAADALILAGLDVGWLLRVLPNQLYYAGFVPFAFFRWFRQPSRSPER